mgnify:CR=1 FL=1
MPIYLEDDDFDIKPKLKNGITKKCVGNSGISKKDNTFKKKNSNSNKEIYNSKHIRIMNDKIEKGKLKRN